MRQDSTNHVLWFLAGIGLGAAIGVLAAPKSGATARRYLGEKASDAGHFLATSGREYVGRGRELYEKGKLLADEASLMYDEARRLVEDSRAAEA
jgi:gas vesicle protein